MRLRTVHDAGAHVVEAPAAALVAEVMRGFGWDVTVTEVAPGRPSVVGVIAGRTTVSEDGAGRTLMFEGHVDVVTEGDPAGWSFDPYAGDVVDGRLRGRGSADMKSGVAAMIHAARAVELGGFDGRARRRRARRRRGNDAGRQAVCRGPGARRRPPAGSTPIDGVIVCEPEGGEVCPVAKGAIRIMVTFIGVMAHGAMPKMGRNPLPAIGSLLIALTEIERGYQAQVGIHPSLGEFSMTPTVLRGGTPRSDQRHPGHGGAGHRCPHRARCRPPGTDHPAHPAGRPSLAAEHDLRPRLTVLDDRPPVDTPSDSPVVQAMLAGHLAATGADAVLGGVPGTTDGTILTRDAGLPTVVYGPGGKWIAHQVDEFVEVADILTCTRAYIAAARHFLRE